MKIVADENIVLLEQFFSDFGELVRLPGRELKSEDVSDADVLLVRSVTQVNEALLSGSSVKFVGSCTIGTDHVDEAYLESRGIKFSNAPGCNANSVVEYLLSCLSILSETHGFDWSSKRVGIVGMGNVGSALYQVLQNVGFDVVAHDPFLDLEGLVSLEEVLKSDLITLHVPLTKSGEYPTHHLINKQNLSSLGEHQILVNTSRGGVVDSTALSEKLVSSPAFTAILDVWEGEPRMQKTFADSLFLCTPHIAGYSVDGKARGTEMVYQALCQIMGLPVRHKVAQFLEEAPLSKLSFTSNAQVDWGLHTAIRACFDIRHDDSNLRRSLVLPGDRQAKAFDGLRKNYRCRREFSATKVQIKQADSSLSRKLKAVGFNVRNA